MKIGKDDKMWELLGQVVNGKSEPEMLDEAKLSHDEFVGKGKPSFNVVYSLGGRYSMTKKNITIKADNEEGAKAAFKKKYPRGKIHSVSKNTVREEEELDELSKSTLKNYVKRAAGDNQSRAGRLGRKVGKENSLTVLWKSPEREKLINRKKYIDKAVDRLTNEELLDEAVVAITPDTDGASVRVSCYTGAGLDSSVGASRIKPTTYSVNFTIDNPYWYVYLKNRPDNADLLKMAEALSAHLQSFFSKYNKKK